MGVPESWSGWWSSFVRHLRAESRSEATISTYTQSAVAFCRWLGVSNGTGAENSAVRRSGELSQMGQVRKIPQPLEVTRTDLEEWIAYELQHNSAATARTRFVSLRAFYNWLVAEGELERSPLERMHPPRIPEQAPSALDERHVAQLLKACAGKDFLSRRDTAIIRLMFDSGVRRSELVGMTVEDVDLAGQMITVTSKGGHRELVYFGVKAARDLDRYLRVRGSHPKAAERRAGCAPLWLAQKGALTGSGLYQVLRDRAAQAGLDIHVRPHIFRHAFADSLKSSGASDEDTMRLGRWRDPGVMQRYGRRQADARARETHRRLSPGDRV